MKQFALYIFCLVIISCTDSAGTINALQRRGYTNIQIIGPGNSFTSGCWYDEDVITEWRAVDNGGKIRTGTTCCSLFGCSIGRVK